MTPEELLSATGRSAVVAPGGRPPDGYESCERVAVRSLDAGVADALAAAWRARRPVVVELTPGLGLDDPARPPEESVAGLETWEWTVGMDLVGERLHHAIWANASDARVGPAPSSRWVELACGLGAREATREGFDVLLPDGTPAVCDGGPLDASLASALGVSVVHRVSLEHGLLRPLGPPGALGTGLAADQLAAVEEPRAGARVIAPAGSGKTRVLTERARSLIGSWGVPAAAVALVAFNVRAADEMRARLDDAGPVRVRTLNALGLRLCGERVTVEEPVVRSILSELVSLRRRAESDPASPWIEALSRVRLGLAAPEAVEDEIADVSDLARVARAYRSELADRGAVDFDEQVVGAIDRLLREPSFRHRSQRAARVLLVDEFQDLTPAHLLLIRLLSGPAGAVFAVGDDDQTIYGYSGATPRWLVEFASHFPGSGEHALATNYRCPPAVVRAAANLLSRNSLRVPKELRPAPRPESDEDSLVVLGPSDAPAAASAARVTALLERGVAPFEVAVLARVNAALAPVQVLLRHHDVPVDGGVDDRFLRRGGVRAALAWLAVASAPGSDLPGDVLREAARRPKRAMSSSLLDLVARQQSQARLADLARWLESRSSSREASKVRDLAADVATVRGAAAGGTTLEVLAAVRYSIGDGGLDASATALDSWSRGAIAAHGDDLDALAELATLEPDPGRFASWLESELATPREPGGVVLASIHAVKGREWPHVVLHQASSGLMPHRLSTDLEEERRVFHVGITRCCESLTVVPGPTESPFVAEMALAGAPPAEPPRPGAAAEASGVASPRRRATTVAPAPDEAAVERLRAWRTERARALGKPAYVVFDDRTLEELAFRLPASAAELLSVRGIGQVKLDAFGDELLALADELRAAPKGGD